MVLYAALAALLMVTTWGWGGSGVVGSSRWRAEVLLWHHAAACVTLITSAEKAALHCDATEGDDNIMQKYDNVCSWLKHNHASNVIRQQQPHLYRAQARQLLQVLEAY
jgi:hypothetical protein